MKTLKLSLLLILLLILASPGCKTKKPTGDNMPTGEVIRQYSDNGDLKGSSYKMKDGSIIKLTIDKSTSSQGHSTQLVFSKNNNTILTLKSGLNRTGEGIGKIYTSANGSDVNYYQEIDASNIILVENQASSGIAGVYGYSGSTNWEGSLNFGNSELTNSDAMISMQTAIPNEVYNNIEPLLVDAKQFYISRPGGNINNLVVGQPIILASFTGSLCRAACAAAAAAAATGCCGATVTVGCVACVAAAAALGSLCIDSCPP